MRHCDEWLMRIDADIRRDDLTVHNLIAVTSIEGRVLDFDPKCGALGPKLIESIVLTPGATAK